MGTDAINSGAVSTTTNGQYIFGFTGDLSNDCSAVAAGTGFTLRNVTGCAFGVSHSESHVQPSAGSIEASLTTSNGGATDFSTIIMTFKEAPVTVYQQGGRGGRSF